MAFDVENDGKLASFDALVEMYALKTGALIRAAGRLGCIAAGADRTQREAADRYTRAVGLAFQIRDDLLDLEKDRALGKTTYPAVLGEEASREKITALTAEAEDAVSVFPDSDFLRSLVGYLAGRSF